MHLCCPSSDLPLTSSHIKPCCILTPFKIIDEDNEKDAAVLDDQREKEKMLFNVIFTAEDGDISSQSDNKKVRTGLGDIKLDKKEKKNNKVKINMMKNIAYILNPLTYVIFSALYFVYYLKFF